MAFQDSQQPFHWHYSELDEDHTFQIRGRTFLIGAVLFSVLLLLLLYAHWICRFRHNSARHAAHAPPPPPTHPPGLDAATINSFQIVLHNSATTATRVGESECCICLGMFEDAEKVKVLPNCRHCFHCECVDKWLSSHTSCPLCRSSLRSDSPV